jgi:hypothetical protein
VKEQAPAVIIPLQHQSAPKEHPADRAILQAAEEIDSGRYQPPAEQLDELGLLPNVALRTGPQAMLDKPVTASDFAHTENSLILAEHPRVKEALARLEQERDDSRTSQEYFEKTAMLRELNTLARGGQKWEGQERWIGSENEESRKGQVLTPLEFYWRLTRVIAPKLQFAHHVCMVDKKPIRMIGAGRILLGREAVLQHKDMPASMQAGRVGLFVMASEKVQILTPGMEKRKDEPMLVATVQWPVATEWMMMNFDEFGIPTTAKHIGWRTALLSMVRSGVLTEKEANRAFPLSSGPVSSWYREQMFEWRNAHRGRVS